MYAEKGEWHLSKSVSLSHLLTTVVLLGGGLTYALGEEKRVTTVEATQKANQEAIKEVKDAIKDLEESQKDLRLEIKKDGERLEEKVDTLIQHIMQNGH